jgi:hypothetical protein
MLSFLNSPLILIVAYSIYKAFGREQNGSKYVSKHLMQKYHGGPPRCWEVVATTKKTPTLRLNMWRGIQTPQAIKKRACDWFINYSLDLFVNG